MWECRLCPRLCGVSREIGDLGFCGQGKAIRIRRAAPHFFEEPPISGTNGSGTVFFEGCSLRCVFCQNRDISRGSSLGQEMTPYQLADLFFQLRDQGVHNINLVTPTHFAHGIRQALEIAKPTLGIPVVYNTSCYERVETLQSLKGLIDIYLPDLKYASSELSLKYSSAPDYPTVAIEALKEMYSQVGGYEYDDDGMLKKGVVVRHLVLPAARRESVAALNALANTLPVDKILLSLMSQYTPEFAMDQPYRELHRRVTTFEYDFVLSHALKLGFKGFMQGRSSASSTFTPDF